MTSDKNNDALLESFLRASSASESERQLQHLLEIEAAPVMRQVLNRDIHRAGLASTAITSVEATADWEDVVSSAREELIRQLTRLRAGEKVEPISNFRGYVGAVTYAAWAEHLRRAYPARSMLLNRVRYLLENRTNQRGFAIWGGVTGNRWCGFARWAGQIPRHEANSKLQRLISEPVAVAREALSTRDFKSINLAALLSKIFSWLEQPIELRHLLDVVSELLEISDRKESLDAETARDLSLETIDRSPSPIETLKWQEYLQWLWKELATLSLPQRSAFLFHAEVTREFEVLGIASMRRIAATLEIPATEIAQIWNELPLPDLEIARRLNLQRQQVINLRRIARDRLGAAWKKWIK
jgi:hypothetical protein